MDLRLHSYEAINSSALIMQVFFFELNKTKENDIEK